MNHVLKSSMAHPFGGTHTHTQSRRQTAGWLRMAGLCTAATLVCGTAAAQAENTVKLGIARYTTHESTSGLNGIGLPPGADATVGDATTVVLAYERMVTPNIGIEVVIGYPPKIEGKAGGSVPFLGKVLTAKVVGPTAFVTWHFGSTGDTWRPYVGAGVNYTRFTGVETPYAYNIELKDSVGFAAHAGVDYAIDKQWGAYASVAALKVKSDLVAVGANVLQTTIDFKPVVFSLGLSYRF